MFNQSRSIKRKRSAITLDTKLKILDLLEQGEGSTQVGKIFGLHEATIRTIKKNEASIRKSVVCGTHPGARFASYSKDKFIAETESILVEWIRENDRNNIVLDGNEIRQKALTIYNEIKNSQPEILNEIQHCQPSTSANEIKDGQLTASYCKRREFAASKGWLTAFLKRQALPCSTHNDEHESDKTRYHENDDQVMSDYVLINEQIIDVQLLISDYGDKSDNEDDDDLFPASEIEKGLELFKKLEDHFLLYDPDVARSTKFQCNLRRCIACYKDLLDAKKKGESADCNKNRNCVFNFADQLKRSTNSTK